MRCPLRRCGECCARECPQRAPLSSRRMAAEPQKGQALVRRGRAVFRVCGPGPVVLQGHGLRPGGLWVVAGAGAAFGVRWLCHRVSGRLSGAVVSRVGVGLVFSWPPSAWSPRLTSGRTRGPRVGVEWSRGGPSPPLVPAFSFRLCAGGAWEEGGADMLRRCAMWLAWRVGRASLSSREAWWQSRSPSSASDEAWCRSFVRSIVKDQGKIPCAPGAESPRFARPCRTVAIRLGRRMKHGAVRSLGRS